jgi:hypothetical protein
VNIVPNAVEQPHPPLWLAGTKPETITEAARSGIGTRCGRYGSSARTPCPGQCHLIKQWMEQPDSVPDPVNLLCIRRVSAVHCRFLSSTVWP